MAISIACGSCGKAYQVGPHLAGKTAKCSCGAAVTIPAAGPAMPTSPQANAPQMGAPQMGQSGAPLGFQPQAPAFGNQPAGAGAAQPGSAFAPLVSTPLSMAQEWNAQQTAPQPKPRQKEVMRYVVAGATILYALVYPAFALMLFRLTKVAAPAVVFTYLPVVLLGAILIIVKNRWGPSVTALAMLFGEFAKGWMLLTVGVGQLFKEGSPLLIISTLFAYAIPAAIFMWCVREEKRRPVGSQDWQSIFNS